MKREFLEQYGLDKEAVDAIMDENGKDINNVRNQLESVQADLDKANATVKKLQENNQDNEELQTEVENLKTQLAATEAERKEALKTAQLRQALTEHGAKDIDYAIFRLGEVEVNDDGTIPDLENRVKQLRDDIPQHFEPVEDPEADAAEQETPPAPGTPGAPGYTVLDTKLKNGQTGGITAESIMAIENNEERQKAIKEHKHLFR